MDANRHPHTTSSQQTTTGSVNLEPHHTSTSNLEDTWMKQAIPPVVPPKQSPLPENDGPQPLSAYYTPHEYVDVNGVRNKVLNVTPMTPAGFGKFSPHVQPQAATNLTREQRIYGLRRSTFGLGVALVVTVAAAIGLGVGLGVGLKQTGGGGSHNGGSSGAAACPAQQSQITTSVSPSFATTTTSPQPTATDTNNNNNNSRATATATTTITLQTLPQSTSTPNLNAQSHLTCPTSNSTILLSSFSPQPQTSQPLKYQILCNSNLIPPSSSSPSSKQDLAGPLKGVQTLEQCWGVCDGMNFFLGRRDVAAVWNYIDGPGNRGECWCVAGTGLRVVGNEGCVTVRPWDG